MFYVAGPLFSIHERSFLEQLVNSIATKLQLDSKNDFFLPHRDVGDIGVRGKEKNIVFFEDLKYLKSADIVIAVLDGQDIDSGTALELGYAYATSKEIFAIMTDKRRWINNEISGINNMVWGVCKEGKRIYRDIDVLIKNLKMYLKKK